MPSRFAHRNMFAPLEGLAERNSTQIDLQGPGLDAPDIESDLTDSDIEGESSDMQDEENCADSMSMPKEDVDPSSYVWGSEEWGPAPEGPLPGWNQWDPRPISRPPSEQHSGLVGTTLLAIDFEAINLQDTGAKTEDPRTMYESEMGVAWVTITEQVLLGLDVGELPSLQYHHLIVQDYIFDETEYKERVEEDLQVRGFNRPLYQTLSQPEICSKEDFPRRVGKFLEYFFADHPKVKMILHAGSNEQEYFQNLGVSLPALDELLAEYTDTQRVWAKLHWKGTPALGHIIQEAFGYYFSQIKDLGLHNGQTDAHWTMMVYLQALIPKNMRKDLGVHPHSYNDE